MRAIAEGRHQAMIRMVILVSACCLFLGQSACSDNKGDDAPVGTVATPQSTPVPKVEPQTQSPVPTPASTPSPEGACASLVTAKCIECHSTARVCEKLGKKSRSRWKRTINRMIDRGAKVNTDETTALLDCLDSGVKELQSVCQ